MFQEDTISAVATAVGEGGIGIIRLSGVNAVKVAENLFKPTNKSPVAQLASHQLTYGKVVDSLSGQAVDEAMLVVMRSPRSYTKEDVVEIHCHGGPVPLRRTLELTLRHGARLAEAGEFTKRAFMNGRLDLVQAEAVMDLIRAKSDASLSMALGQLQGSLSTKVKEMRHEILALIAHLEATIDFPEEDIDELTTQEVRSRLTALLTQMDHLLAGRKTGRILREGLETVIIGKPNVGKSSLLNALLREQRAIVTDIPGTTRDIIEESVSIRGIPLKIVDTAGIRETKDIVEKIGVERARALIEKADLILLLLDASAPLTDEDKEVLRLLEGKEAMIILNKSDLPPLWQETDLQQEIAGKKILKLSVLDGSGLDELEEAIVKLVYSGAVSPKENAFLQNVRQADLLEKASEQAKDALRTIDAGLPPDFVVVDLRSVWESLGEITGDTVGEDIIQQIFSQFCIGK
ncbi:tRNA uridine-5-carboxymethylaminomethyl(34) synthesis GTPase MnmE [Azotosporobacter soli]|uniref:tRNA uridine-5-carboxymethylaminomethyl(34) synthesis GTPase MnmE n=1 Tax=Azotosporobacter soli TaxID=3055040 RepID=UPI0031FE7F2B